MTIDTKHLNCLKKVVESGYTDEKAILGLTTEDMIGVCKSITEIVTILEMQKAIKGGRLITFLLGKDADDS